MCDEKARYARVTGRDGGCVPFCLTPGIIHSVWFNRFGGSPGARERRDEYASCPDTNAPGVNTGDSRHSTSVCGRGLKPKATGRGSTCIMTRLQPCTAARGLCAMHRTGAAAAPDQPWQGQLARSSSRDALMHLSRIGSRSVFRGFRGSWAHPCSLSLFRRCHIYWSPRPDIPIIIEFREENFYNCIFKIIFGETL